MRLSATDVAALPLPVALADRDGTILAHSPEWSGGGPGTVAYRLPVASLFVAGEDQDGDIATLMAELVGEITRAALAGEGARRLRLGVLASSLALVGGMATLSAGTTEDVLEHLNAVLATVSRHPVDVVAHRPGAVPDAAILALALRQLVVNARRHDDATRVALTIGPGPTFTMTWAGGEDGDMVTAARHPSDRGRWGLGFVRLACDALGAVYLAPAPPDDGRVTAVLAFDAGPRLRLPLARARDGVIDRASPAWDEETHSPPGTALPQRWHAAVAAAAARPGSIARDGSARARLTGSSTWIAIVPSGTRDQARDLIRGLEHERELLTVADPFATRINGLAGVISLLLGDPPRLVTPHAFDTGYPKACAALAVLPLGEAFVGPRAPDPSVVAVLSARLGASVRNANGRLEIDANPTRGAGPIERRLANREGVITLP